jgi:hypothetical protein
MAQPNGWEKSNNRIEICCTDSELMLWRTAFGKGKTTDTIRALANREVYRRAGIPQESTIELPDKLPSALKREIRRHTLRIAALFKKAREQGEA